MTDILRVDEAADILRLQPSTLRVWRHRGQGPRSFKIGGHVVYSREELERYMTSQMETTTIGGEY